jgi:hypothetical protein
MFYVPIVIAIEKNESKINLMKAFIITIIIFLTCTSVFGQENELFIGIELGPTYTFYRGNEVLETLNKPAYRYFGGISIEYKVKNRFSIQTDISYERKGTVARGMKPNFNVDTFQSIENQPFHTRIYFDYITIPLLLKLQTGNKVNFYVEGGGFIGFLLDGKFVTTGDTITKQTENMTKLNNKDDLGISFGLGFNIKINKNKLLTFGLRNNLGLVSIANTPVYDDGTIKSNSTNFVLGYKWDILNDQKGFQFHSW